MSEKVTLEDLFASWREELGYNKAILLSCNYPVQQVLKMSEEDAEAEVQEISYGV